MFKVVCELREFGFKMRKAAGHGVRAPIKLDEFMNHLAVKFKVNDPMELVPQPTHCFDLALQEE